MWFSKEFIAFSCHGKALKDLRIEYYEANEYDLTRLTSILVVIMGFTHASRQHSIQNRSGRNEKGSKTDSRASFYIALRDYQNVRSCKMPLSHFDHIRAFIFILD